MTEGGFRKTPKAIFLSSEITYEKRGPTVKMLPYFSEPTETRLQLPPVLSLCHLCLRLMTVSEPQDAYNGSSGLVLSRWATNQIKQLDTGGASCNFGVTKLTGTNGLG